MSAIPPIQWVRLDYRRVQHLVTEINALVSCDFFYFLIDLELAHFR